VRGRGTKKSFVVAAGLSLFAFSFILAKKNTFHIGKAKKLGNFPHKQKENSRWYVCV